MTKVYNVWAIKSTEELCLMALKIDTKFEGKLACAFKNDMRNLANLHRLKWMNSAFNKPFCTCLTGPLFLDLILVPIVAPFWKRPFFPLQFGQEENISGNSIERRVYILIYFENWQGAPCSHRQSRNRMMNTFIIVNIAP